MGRWFPPDEERVRAVADHALERGVGWIDTAEVYGAGRSERLLGDLLSRRPPEAPRPFLSTKLSWEHLRGSMVRPSLLGSLRRLGLPRVDLYLVHAPDRHVPIAETMHALEALVEEGRVGAIGVSNFSLEEMEAAESALRSTEIVANQVRFNLFEREDADPILAHCRERGIVVEAYSPTAQGLLAGRFLDGKGPAGKDVRREHGLYSAERFPEIRRRAQAIRAIAAEANVPMLSLALHALARQGAAPVVGASRPAQLDETLAAWAVRPAERLLDRAEAIARGDAD
jgi:aryl-alcohol dehydrogenase-like predicted oxidoreductase